LKVELERKTTGAADRSIRLVANDETHSPATIRDWLKMLQLAEQWLLERYPEDKA
jgi:hypothetical protein